MSKTEKTCQNCAYSSMNAISGNLCDLYNKSSFIAMIHCKGECWKKKVKETK